MESWRKGDRERPSSERRRGVPSKRHFSPLPITPVETIQRVSQVDGSPLLPPSRALGLPSLGMLVIPSAGENFYDILVLGNEKFVLLATWISARQPTHLVPRSGAKRVTGCNPAWSFKLLLFFQAPCIILTVLYISDPLEVICSCALFNCQQTSNT